MGATWGRTTPIGARLGDGGREVILRRYKKQGEKNALTETATKATKQPVCKEGTAGAVTIKERMAATQPGPLERVFNPILAPYQGASR